ncbi:MAG TPA: hypothetical protein VOB72_16590 [Candidatus Dormibacteraeota bacterium]|nr:hypothetical protein [Candidatus Dormibacteraeota bacterium]
MARGAFTWLRERCWLVASAALTGALLLGWGLYLAGPRRPLLAAYGVAIAGLLALAVIGAARRPGTAAASPGRRRAIVVAAVLAVLAVAAAYQLAVWPHLLNQGDSAEYDTMARLAVLQHRYYTLPWRTPGYPATLWEVYRLAGVDNREAVRLVQLGLSLLTAVAMMAIAWLLTRRRSVALVALLLGAFAAPIVAPSAYLMSETQAVFLATAGLLLVLSVHRGGGVAAALALGPVLALGYETRVALLPWVGLLGLAALAARCLGWRGRAVLIAGVLLTLAPVAAANAQGPFHVPTPGPAVDLSAENLGQDRFILYPTSPNSPELLEALHQAIIDDGADTDYWPALPPADVARFNAARLHLMEGWILGHASAFMSLSLRRALLLYRYDQRPDMTYIGDGGRPWLLLVDGLLILAVAGLASLVRARRWGAALLLTGPPVALTLALSAFHVEPRYSLPALPAVALLAAIGAGGLARLAASRRLPPTRLATAAAVAAGLALLVPLSEGWLWPALADAYAPTPTYGTHQLASCSTGHQMLTAVAWRPGTPMVVAGGPSGMARWDITGHDCSWQPTPWDNVWDLGFTPDGGRLVIAAYHARAVDATTWTVYPGPAGQEWLAGHGTEMLSASFDPAGRRFAFAATGLRRLGVYDLASRRVALLPLPANPIAVRWSPDGSTIAVSGADRTIRLYDARLRLLREQALAHRALALDWSPSAAALAAGDDAGNLLLWRLDGAGRLGTPAMVAAHGGALHGVAFSPDGTLLASASADRLAKVWDASSLVETRTLRGHTAAVWDVGWSSSSDRVVTAAADGSLAVWSAR